MNTQIIEVTLHKKRSDLKSGKTGLKPAQLEAQTSRLTGGVMRLLTPGKSSGGKKKL